MKSIKLFATLAVVILSVAFISGVVPADAQDITRVPPTTNIVVFNGHNPGEVILSWDAVYGATHYRIGCVNMDRDYPRAKATVTGNWQEAFVYVDVEAENLSPDRPSHTMHGLQEGAYHACSVLTNNARYGQPTWPRNPAWQYLTVTDHGGSCPAFELTVAPDTTEPLSIAQVGQLVRPAIANLTVVPSDGNTYGGTGFMVRSDGLMVTNRHVVDDAETITAEMILENGETVEFTGKVLGKGILADLAAVQLSSNRTFSTLDLGDSDALGYGDEVSAWGYPISNHLGTDPTLNTGIVSAPHRIFDDTDWIQIDADINPGNSGGPLLDRFANVIGVNTAGYETLSGRIITGINLAIASNEVRDRLATYEAGGPDQATYRNLRWDYGYSIVIPKGWYIFGESGEGLTRQFVWFDAYGLERTSIIRTFRIPPPYTDRNTELRFLTGFFWNVYLDLVAEGNEWVYLERVSARPVEIGGQVFFRLEYRSRETAEDCTRSHVALVSISTSHPEKPFGFVTDFAVCEDVLSQYGAERESILRTFRP